MNLNQPFAGEYPVTQSFGALFTDASGHKGIDYGMPIGTPVLAAAEGSVAAVRHQLTGYGIHVILTHADGFQTLYAHLSACSVQSGQSVQRGALLGLSGSTGNSTGPHLHFELRQGGKAVDPTPFLTVRTADVSNPSRSWTVSCERLNVRSGPGISYPASDSLPRGSVVPELANSETRWIKITPGRWAAARYQGAELMKERSFLGEE